MRWGTGVAAGGASTNNCSGCGTGKGLSITAFSTEKVAVLAPIPSARVRTRTLVSPGDLMDVRAANRRSCRNASQTGSPPWSR